MSSRDTFSSDFQDFRIPDALRGASTVKRESRVDYIWDTHGNYEGFLFNMRKLWLIDSAWNWIGKHRRLILIGDIYADRHFGSIQTAQHIEKLMAQWAQIDQLAGNHEDVMLSLFDHVHHPHESVINYFTQVFLTWKPRDIEEYSGLQEFASFKKNASKTQSWQSLLIQLKPETILQRMRALKKWQKVLTNICRLQVGKVLNDTLFVHTDPVDGMIDILEQYDWDIEKINAIFRAFLVQTLREGKHDKDLIEEAFKIRAYFLNADNRRTNDEDTPLLSHGAAGKLKTKLNIRRIIHGHTDHVHEQTIFRGGLEITSADNSSFKRWNKDPWNTCISAGSILQNGHRIGPKE